MTPMEALWMAVVALLLFPPLRRRIYRLLEPPPRKIVRIEGKGETDILMRFPDEASMDRFVDWLCWEGEDQHNEFLKKKELHPEQALVLNYQPESPLDIEAQYSTEEA